MLGWVFAIALGIWGLAASHKLEESQRVLKEYQKSLMKCEEATIGDKILDKIKEKHDD